MNEFKKSENIVESTLYIKSTARLDEEVKKELEIPDPEDAEAILRENTEGDDGEGSSRDDRESS